MRNLGLKKEEFLKKGILEVSSKTIESYNFTMQPITPEIRIYNVQDFKDLKTDNFSFETTLKNGFKSGSAACQRLQVLILCENDVMIIPLSAKGCVGELGLFIAGYSLDAQSADLSKFGCNLSEWTSFKIKSVNKNVSITINHQAPFNLTFKNPP